MKENKDISPQNLTEFIASNLVISSESSSSGRKMILKRSIEMKLEMQSQEKDKYLGNYKLILTTKH